MPIYNVSLSSNRYKRVQNEPPTIQVLDQKGKRRNIKAILTTTTISLDNSQTKFLYLLILLQSNVLFYR